MVVEQLMELFLSCTDVELFLVMEIVNGIGWCLVPIIVLIAWPFFFNFGALMAIVFGSSVTTHDLLCFRCLLFWKTNSLCVMGICEFLLQNLLRDIISVYTAVYKYSIYETSLKEKKNQ